MFALLADYAYTNIGFLDHADIIATIADAQHNLPCILLDPLGNDGLLSRRDSAADNSGSLSGNRVEKGSKLMQGYGKGCAVDYQHCVGLH